MRNYWLFFILVFAISCSKKPLTENNTSITNNESETIIEDENENILPIDGFDVSGEQDFYVIFYDDKIYYINNIDKKYTVLPENSYYLGSDGYYRLKIDKSLTTYDSDELVLIEGKYFSEIFANFFNDGVNEYSNFDEYENYDYHYMNIKKITGSKFYTEFVNGKFIEYKPENLYSTYLVGCSCHPYWWNPNSIPWVEGDADAGIDSYIEIEYNSPIKTLSVLNGFVDSNNLKLFKENNRPKVITVVDFDNKKEYTVDIQDHVYFSDITFENTTQHIKIIIKEVYSGTKYNDTCITALVDRKNISTGSNYLFEMLNRAIEEYELF